MRTQSSRCEPEPPSTKGLPPAALAIMMLLLVALSASGCLQGPDDGDEGPGPETFTFLFEDGAQGWVVRLADYTVGDEANLMFVNDTRALPEYLGGADALFVSSKNTPDDLFVYFVRQLEGLEPDTEYDIAFNITFASKDPVGSIGAGGSPGEAVQLRAGASPVEFTRVVDSHDIYRISPDVGDSIHAGENGIHLGNIAKPADGNDDFVLLSRDSHGTPFSARTDAQGRIWVLFGTDSGYEGVTEMYYTSITIGLTPAT